MERLLLATSEKCTYLDSGPIIWPVSMPLLMHIITKSTQPVPLWVEADLAVCGRIYSMENDEEPFYCGINSKQHMTIRESGRMWVEELKTESWRNVVHVLKVLV